MRRFTIDLVLLVVLTLLFRATLTMAVGGDAGCANTGVTDAYQPYHSELSAALEAAGSNSLGAGYESLGTLKAGYPSYTYVPGTIPCVILKSIAWVESGWRQASTAARGTAGNPLVSYGCGYGIMQITSPMTSYGLIDPAKQQRIAREYRYNVSYGAMMLVSKWNYPDSIVPRIGNNNPAVLEDWYYAVWAYNGMSSVNNPRYYNPSRPPFNGTQPWQNYPYQEKVWGYAANPPIVNGAPLWSPVSITLPPDAWMTDPPGYIPDPTPTHMQACTSPPPTPTPTATPTPLPILSVSSTSMAFLSEPGKNPNPQPLLLFGDRGSSLGWSAQLSSGDEDWLGASPLGGSSVPAQMWVWAYTLPDLSGTRRNGTITFTNLTRPTQPPIVVNVSVWVGNVWRLRFPAATY